MTSIASTALLDLGHHLLPNPGKFNNILSDLAWQTVDWGIPPGFPKHSVPCFGISNGGVDALDPNLTNTKIWDGNQNKRSPCSGYDPSSKSTSSDHTSPPPPSQPTRSSIPKGHRRPRRNPSEETNKPKRPRRTKEPKDEEESRARIREKNRIAADKCRGRQRTAIQKLNTKHDSLEDQNRRLSRTLNELVAERIVLKNMLVEHGKCGCELMESYLRGTATRWVGQVEVHGVI